MCGLCKCENTSSFASLLQWKIAQPECLAVAIFYLADCGTHENAFLV